MLFHLIPNSPPATRSGKSFQKPLEDDGNNDDDDEGDDSDKIDNDNGDDVWDDLYLLLGRTKAFKSHGRGKRRWEEDLSRVFGFSIKLGVKIGDTLVVAMLPGSWLKRGRRSSGDVLG